jgi:hypothetical protein
MDKRDTILAGKIVREYIRFMRETSSLVEEAKRATVLALKKVLKLKDGGSVLIKEDGSLEIKPKDKEYTMPENKNEGNKKLTLNGRDVTAEELERQREAVKNQKGARLEEVSQGDFRLRLND